MAAEVLRVRSCAPRVAGVTGGRVMAAGDGWAWLTTAGGSVHLSRRADAEGPLSLVVPSLNGLEIGADVELDASGATISAHASSSRRGDRPDVLAACASLMPHAWADEAAHSLGATPFADLAPRLLGRGGGLTPEGDDALCGYLAALAVVAPGAFAHDAAFVAANLDRTGEPSRSLLAAAAHDGGTFAAALVLRDALLAADRPMVAAALRGLVRVGRTTGRAILTGMCRGIVTLGGTD